VVKRKIRKFQGGGMDMGNASNQKQSASKANATVSAPSPGDTGGEGGFNPKDNSTNQVGNTGSNTGNNTGSNNTKTGNAKINKPFNATSFLPASVQLVGKVANMVTKGYRQKKAKGEEILGKKVTLPSTRDYYRIEGKPLDVMSPEGRKYLMDDKRLTIPKPPPLSKENNNVSNLCPDGTTPPCKTPATQIKNPVSTQNSFLSGFRSYDDGGEVVISSNVDKDLL
jgi:hypothetical protein